MKKLSVLVLLVILCVFPSVKAEDKCASFDQWIGGERFDYQIDSQGNWNLPSDAEIVATVTFPKSGLWKYYSANQDASYVIVFLSLEPTYPIGKRSGQHDICVYKLSGLGMSNE